jgi:hypothetical protein
MNLVLEAELSDWPDGPVAVRIGYIVKNKKIFKKKFKKG